MHYFRLDAHLKTIESAEQFMRPNFNSPAYEDLLRYRNLHKSKQLKAKMSVIARERWYLLKLKAKFAGEKCDYDYHLYYMQGYHV